MFAQLAHRVLSIHLLLHIGCCPSRFVNLLLPIDVCTSGSQSLFAHLGLPIYRYSSGFADLLLIAANRVVHIVCQSMFVHQQLSICVCPSRVVHLWVPPNVCPSCFADILLPIDCCPSSFACMRLSIWCCPSMFAPCCQSICQCRTSIVVHL